MEVPEKSVKPVGSVMGDPLLADRSDVELSLPAAIAKPFRRNRNTSSNQRHDDPAHGGNLGNMILQSCVRVRLSHGEKSVQRGFQLSSWVAP
jgi:hypothetical protein